MKKLRETSRETMPSETSVTERFFFFKKKDIQSFVHEKCNEKKKINKKTERYFINRKIDNVFFFW